MSIKKSSVTFALVSCLFFANVGSAQPNVRTKTIERERALEQPRKTMDTEPSDKAVLPEDTSRRWLVSELRISGNNLISTKELMKKLTRTYNEYEIDTATGKPKKEKITGMPIVKEFYDFRVLIEIIINPGKEREVSLKTIHGFTKYVLGIYREKGYSGIYVYVPKETVDREGNLVGQTLHIEVLEAKVAEIRVERYDFKRQKQETGFLKDSVIKSWSPIKEGNVIKKKHLDNFINLININPDRYVSAVTSKSSDPNALNLTYDVYEANPWHWYLQVDNSGTEERKWSPRIGLTNTNFTGIDDRFSAMYQAPWESGINENYALFGSYDFPLLTPRLRLNLYGGHSEFNVTPQGGPFNFLGRGSFYGSVLSYNVFQINNWFVDVTGSLSQESSKVTAALGSESDVDMDLWGIGVNIHRSDDVSNTSLIFNRIESMGGSSREEFDLARSNADPDFTIYNFGASHSHYLDASKVHRVSGFVQSITSNERLVPAKMTTFGGFYSVRGYDEDEIVADGGILMSGQYEFDLVKHSESIESPVDKSEATLEDMRRDKPWLRKLAPLAFIDFGRAKIKNALSSERGIQELCSLGVGTIAEFGDNFSTGIYYGWPLRGTEDTDKGDGRLNFTFVYRHKF
jgi:hemolysin activation/secretion protein